MTKYKLVPVEPTPEMLKAADLESGSRGLLSIALITWQAMLDAAPEVQAKPVAWAKDTGKKLRITHMDMQGDDGWRPLGYIDTAPQPAKQAEQEPFTVLVRKHSWLPGQWESAPCGFPDYGKQWADERINVYTTPQPAKREPLTDAQIAAVVDQVKADLEGEFLVEFVRVIEAAHGIGSLCDSGTANTALPCTNLEQDSRALLDAAKKLLKELDVLREADPEKEDWMPVNDADDDLRAAIAKVEGKA